MLIALLSGNLAAARAGLKMLRAPSIARALALIGLATGATWLAPAAMAHAGLYVERARLQEHSVLGKILAQPLCTGAAQTTKAPQ